MAQKEKRRKFRAILAGGLVLGVGVTITLASWNDSEFAEGLFGSGHFNMQGSADGTNFSDHAAGSPATLDFATASGLLSPEDTVAAPFVLRLDEETTNDATVTVKTATGAGDAAISLSYGIVQVSSIADCTPEATGTVIVPEGTAMSSVAGANPFALNQSTAAGEAGDVAVLCVQVTAGIDLIPGKDATAIWEFVGESVS